MWGAFSADPRPAAAEDVAAHAIPTRYQGGVGVSTDGGRTWTRVGHGHAGDARPRTSSSIPRARRAGARSTPPASAAASTSPSTAARPGRRRTRARAARSPSPGASRAAADGTLYLVVARRSERGRDRRRRRRRALPLHRRRRALDADRRCPPGTNGPNGLAVDPKDPRRLYLAAWGRATPGGDTGGRDLRLDRRRRATWTNVLPAYQHVYDVTIDPRDPAVLYASRLRPVGVSLDRSRRDLDAHSRLQLQVGTAGDPRPADPARSTSRRTAAACGTVRRRAIRTRPRTWCLPTLPQRRARRVAWRRARISRPGEAARSARRGQRRAASTPTRSSSRARTARAIPPAGRAPPADAALEALVAHQTALLAERSGGGEGLGAGAASTFDPAKRPRAAARRPAFRSRRHAAGQRLHRVPAPRRAGPAARPGARDREPLPDRARGRARRRSPAGALRASTSASACPSTSASSACPGRDEDLLAVGRQLEGKSCASPVGLSAAEWQIAGRKIWNWGEKNQHIRDARVAGRASCWPSPEVAALVPEDARAARAAGRGHRPLVHHGPALVVAVGLRAHRHRDVRAREPEGGVPPVPGRGADVVARAYKQLLRGRSWPGSRTRSCSW